MKSFQLIYRGFCLWALTLFLAAYGQSSTVLLDTQSLKPDFPYRYGKTRINPESNPPYLPKQENLRYLEYKGYFSIYDISVNTPLLTIVHLGKNPELMNKTQQGKAYSARSFEHSSRPKNMKFKSDSRLIALERIGHNDYRDDTQTFSRGHLTPAGDFDARSLKVQTYMTTNIAPQIQKSFNDGLWNKLEEQVRALAEKPSQSFTVITGVVHDDPKHARKLNNKISIPTHFYKIVIEESPLPQSSSLPVSVDAFLMENRFYSAEELDLCEYLVPIQKIEDLTGINFLISLPDQERERLIQSTGTFQGLCPPVITVQ